MRRLIPALFVCGIALAQLGTPVSPARDAFLEPMKSRDLIDVTNQAARVAVRTSLQVDRAVADCSNKDTSLRAAPRWSTIPETTVLSPGQRIRLVLQSNYNGFVYALAIQSSGKVEDLYPLDGDLHAQLKPYTDAALPAFCITNDSGASGDNVVWILVTKSNPRAEQFRREMKAGTDAVDSTTRVDQAWKNVGGSIGSRDIIRDESDDDTNSSYRVAKLATDDLVFSVHLRQN